METGACPGVVECLRGLAIASPQPLGLTLGITTIAEVQAQYSVIDRIGTSYTGGPVLNLSEWEIELDGVLDVQLAFSATGILDVVTLKAEKSHLEPLLRDFSEHLCAGHDDSTCGSHRRVFLSASRKIVVEANALDSRFMVSYFTDDFRNARLRARKLYAP